MTAGQALAANVYTADGLARPVVPQSKAQGRNDEGRVHDQV